MNNPLLKNTNFTGLFDTDGYFVATHLDKDRNIFNDENPSYEYNLNLEDVETTILNENFLILEVIEVV